MATVQKEWESCGVSTDVSSESLGRPLSGDRDKEAYEMGQNIEYFSQTLQKWLPAKINSQGSFPIQEGLPSYSVVVGVGGKSTLRDDVLLEHLRLSLNVDETVYTYDKRQGEWRPAVLIGTHSGDSTSALTGYKTQLIDGGSNAPISITAPEEVKRRFSVGRPVSAYLGRREGWVTGNVGFSTDFMSRMEETCCDKELIPVEVDTEDGTLTHLTPSYLLRSLCLL
eukprot:TRINITY_DN80203_c0_g1_i1.p1 TRINITY_DN80203_c0_g1~~TRINITY_DN80203_c0_g1_i1.p1  ORF type:complete len:239 (-),score=35.82 TRINITY_DN80203_c0_g1_i1:534-1208(-)